MTTGFFAWGCNEGNNFCRCNENAYWVADSSGGATVIKGNRGFQGKRAAAGTCIAGERDSI